MINRSNWKLTKAFLEYRQYVDLISPGSIKVEMTHLRYILEWADEMTFHKVSSLRPSLPEYMLTARLDRRRKLSEMHVKKTLSTARRFFTWLVENYPEYRVIKRTWIATLKPRRGNGSRKEKKAVSLEEILVIAAARVEGLVEERIRAAAVFWYLSGIRVGAFVSLPLKAVDLNNLVVLQYPDLGVRTKNRKHGKTFLLDIPELLAVVRAWDDRVRSILPDSGFWFAPFSPDTGEIDIACTSIGEHREALARKNLQAWLDKVGLPYHTPHEFRHGHVHYGLERARTIADYKAVSMNVMHSNMDITDETYSRLSEQDIRARISDMGKQGEAQSNDVDEVFTLFQEFLEWRKTIKK